MNRSVTDTPAGVRRRPVAQLPRSPSAEGCGGTPMRLTRHAWIMPAIFLVACAATAPLPPSRNLEAGDLKTLAGRWEGSGITVDGRRFNWACTVQPDGSYVASSPHGEAE